MRIAHRTKLYINVSNIIFTEVVVYLANTSDTDLLCSRTTGSEPAQEFQLDCRLI